MFATFPTPLDGLRNPVRLVNVYTRRRSASSECSLNLYRRMRSHRMLVELDAIRSVPLTTIALKCTLFCFSMLYAFFKLSLYRTNAHRNSALAGTDHSEHLLCLGNGVLGQAVHFIFSVMVFSNCSTVPLL